MVAAAGCRQNTWQREGAGDDRECQSSDSRGILDKKKKIRACSSLETVSKYECVHERWKENEVVI